MTSTSLPGPQVPALPIPEHGSMTDQLKRDNSSDQWQSADHARLTQIWEEEIKNPARYVRYTKAAALLLSWEETDMNTDEEVRFLKMKNRFNQ
jgi:hypothetical protein